MGATGLAGIEARMAAAAARSSRSDAITLVVVTKYASDEEIEAVIGDGAVHLGESRADSLRLRAARWPEVKWHFVGQLQGNKVGAVRPVAHLLHSMDRPALAGYWSDGDAPPVLVQVNLAGEPGKGGVPPDQTADLVERCLTAGIEVRGLMAVPPRPAVPSDSRPWFAALRELRDQVAADHPRVSELSMGMTDDFEVAIGEGATILRVGRAIFEPFRNEG